MCHLKPYIYQHGVKKCEGMINEFTTHYAFCFRFGLILTAAVAGVPRAQDVPG